MACMECLEYCCCSGAPTYYFEMLDKLQKRICRTVGHSLAASLDLGSSSKCSQPKSSIGITLIDVHLNWLNWFHFLILEQGLLFILIDCIIFLLPFLDIIRMSMSTVSFFAQLDCGILCP